MESQKLEQASLKNIPDGWIIKPPKSDYPEKRKDEHEVKMKQIDEH
jgi:hypothetical protein